MTVKTHEVTRAMGSGKVWIQNLTFQSKWKENPEITNGRDEEEYVQNVECIKTGNYKGIAIERGIVVALVDRNAPADLVTYLQEKGIAVILPPSMVGEDFVGIENAIARNQAFWRPDDTGRIVCRCCGARFYERDWNGWDCPACGPKRRNFKMKLSEYLEKYELDPYDKERFNMEAVFKKEIFSTEHECSIVLFEDPETAEKSFLVSTTTDSSLYGEGDFYDDFLPYTQEASILISKWLFSNKFRMTENAKAICKAVNNAQKNEENELDVEERMEQSISCIAGEDGDYLKATEEWQKWREDFAGDYICCTNEGDLIISTPNGLLVEEWENNN